MWDSTQGAKQPPLLLLSSGSALCFIMWVPHSLGPLAERRDEQANKREPPYIPSPIEDVPTRGRGTREDWLSAVPGGLRGGGARAPGATGRTSARAPSAHACSLRRARVPRRAGSRPAPRAGASGPGRWRRRREWRAPSSPRDWRPRPPFVRLSFRESARPPAGVSGPPGRGRPGREGIWGGGLRSGAEGGARRGAGSGEGRGPKRGGPGVALLQEGAGGGAWEAGGAYSGSGPARGGTGRGRGYMGGASGVGAEPAAGAVSARD